MQKSICAAVFSIANTLDLVRWRSNAVQTSQVIGEGLRQERMLQELQQGVKNKFKTGALLRENIYHITAHT